MPSTYGTLATRADAARSPRSGARAAGEDSRRAEAGGTHDGAGPRDPRPRAPAGAGSSARPCAQLLHGGQTCPAAPGEAARSTAGRSGDVPGLLEVADRRQRLHVGPAGGAADLAGEAELL